MTSFYYVNPDEWQTMTLSHVTCHHHRSHWGRNGDYSVETSLLGNINIKLYSLLSRPAFTIKCALDHPQKIAFRPFSWSRTLQNFHFLPKFQIAWRYIPELDRNNLSGFVDNADHEGEFQDWKIFREAVTKSPWSLHAVLVKVYIHSMYTRKLKQSLDHFLGSTVLGSP